MSETRNTGVLACERTVTAAPTECRRAYHRQDACVPWVRLGDYIEVVNTRNTNGWDYPFYGINKDKTFMRTVANTDGLDASKYSVLTKGLWVFSGMQTGRDVCIRVGLYDEDAPILISPAYTIFRVKEVRGENDDCVLLPKYLFIFFNRNEMDRYGWFLSDSSIRSNLDWDRFCDIKIPLPSIEVQRELVAVYEGLKGLAQENEAMLQPLSEACHAFIADCKRKYPAATLGEYIEECDERNSDGHPYPYVGININKEFMPTNANTDGLDCKKYKVVRSGVFVFSGMQTGRDVAVRLGLYNKTEPALISPAYTTFVVKEDRREEMLPEYLFIQFTRKEMDRLGWFYSDSSIRSNLDWERFTSIQVPLPPKDVQAQIVALYHCYDECKRIASEARDRLGTICPALIQQGTHLQGTQASRL